MDELGISDMGGYYVIDGVDKRFETYDLAIDYLNHVEED